MSKVVQSSDQLFRLVISFVFCLDGGCCFVFHIVWPVHSSRISTYPESLFLSLTTEGRLNLARKTKTFLSSKLIIHF